MRTAALVVVTALAAGCGGSATLGSGLLLPGYDRTVRPQDDLYQFADGTWQKQAQIPPDLAEYGSFAQITLQSQNEQRQLIEQAESDQSAPAGSNERKIGDLYASYMDSNRVNQLGAAPLKPDFAAINAVATPADLVRYLAEAQRYGATTPIGLNVGQDDKDATSYITQVGQDGLALPDRDYYLATDAKSVTVRNQYQAYVAKMWQLAGLPDPQGAATNVLNLETQLAKAQWTEVRNRDAVATYNKFAVPAADQATPGLDWSAYLSAAGINAPNLVIAQPSYFTALAGMFTSVPLNVWKQYLEWHAISDSAPYLSDDFVNARFDFVGKVLSGRQQNAERWKRGVSAVNSAMGEALGQLYVAKYFSSTAKERALDLVNNLIKAYRDSIQKVDWMTPPTKAAAESKLSKLAVKIGYPDKWKDYSTLVVKRDDLLGNMRRASLVADHRSVAKLGKPVDRTEWGMTPQTVNAYYNASMNEIVFPAAILQPPFFDPGADGAINYGAIGAVMGHEISHAFDDQGSKYDGDGNLHDWWTPADKTAFDRKTAALVARYNSFSPLPGEHINGALTLGENIADLSGLTVAYRAYHASLGTNQAPVLDGFTGDQRFFLGFAQIWRSKQRPESVHAQLLTDPHSPSQFRVNGVVPDVDAFYTAFDLKSGDKLYLPPDQRIHIW
ncbi:MAG TPA: M13 family metallopeptidase [Pseudonocardia sp.]